MNRKFEYQNAEGKKVTLHRVENVERNGIFFRVTYTPSFRNETKVTNIRGENVVRYDE